MFPTNGSHEAPAAPAPISSESSLNSKSESSQSLLSASISSTSVIPNMMLMSQMPLLSAANFTFQQPMQAQMTTAPVSLAQLSIPLMLPPVEIGRSFAPAIIGHNEAGINTGLMNSLNAFSPLDLSGVSTASIISNNSVPEFLYQLTKMLTENNRTIIEWSPAGRIEVHNPTKLASEVLHKYFRHSKYSSFQRQLNYFGFRKIAGKGKMAPCSYINDAVTPDIRTLLTIKRKTSAAERAKAAEGGAGTEETSKRAALGSDILPATIAPMFLNGNDLTNFANKRQRLETNTVVQDMGNYKVAVGKGVKHQLNGYLKNTTTTTQPAVPVQQMQAPRGRLVSHANYLSHLSHPSAKAATSAPAPLRFLDPSELGMSVEDSLNELKDNFRSAAASAFGTLNDNSSLVGEPSSSKSPLLPSAGIARMLARDDSLVNLAMLPTLEIGNIPTNETTYKESSTSATDSSEGFGFIDFPNPDVDPSK